LNCSLRDSLAIGAIVLGEASLAYLYRATL
jgi:hypothetical protein